MNGSCYISLRVLSLHFYCVLLFKIFPLEVKRFSPSSFAHVSVFHLTMGVNGIEMFLNFDSILGKDSEHSRAKKVKSLQ